MMNCNNCKNRGKHGGVVCETCVGYNNYESNGLITEREIDISNELRWIKEAVNKRFGAPKLLPNINKVHFNDPVTVVLWSDGTKTIVRCGEDDIFDPEKGLAMAIAKKALGNRGNYYEIFKKWLPEEKNNEIAVDIGKYVEVDTECDLCEHKGECDLIEITTVYDTCIHFLPNIGNVCKKKECLYHIL